MQVPVCLLQWWKKYRIICLNKRSNRTVERYTVTIKSPAFKMLKVQRYKNIRFNKKHEKTKYQKKKC